MTKTKIHHCYNNDIAAFGETKYEKAAADPKAASPVFFEASASKPFHIAHGVLFNQAGDDSFVIGHRVLFDKAGDDSSAISRIRGGFFLLNAND